MSWPFVAPAALAAALAMLPFAASAHVTLQTREAPAGTTQKLVLQVGHGCAGSPTREIRVKIPDGFAAVKPMPKPGWEVTTTVGPLAAPYDDHGTRVTEGVTEIRWASGRLSDAHYDEFVFRARLPSHPGTVHVPVVQLCETGEHRWIEVPDEGAAAGSLKEPAPALRLTAPAR